MLLRLSIKYRYYVWVPVIGRNQTEITAPLAGNMSTMIKEELIEKYQAANTRLLLLDYDGTLVNFASTPGQAIPPGQVLHLLTRLALLPRTRVIIITGRSYQNMDKFLGHLPVDIVAEHGAMFKENGVWGIYTEDTATSWKKDICPALRKVAALCPDSFIEEKNFSLTWHYRNVEPELGHSHSRELIKMLKKQSGDFLKVVDGNKIVEVMATGISKGEIVKKIVKRRQYDYMICIGDDRTDEDMFEALATDESSFTVKVGEGPTSAKYRFGAVEDVLHFLGRLSAD